VPVAEVDLERILRQNKQAQRFTDDLSHTQEQSIRSIEIAPRGEGRKKGYSEFRPLLGCGNAGSRRPRRSTAPLSCSFSCNARSFTQKFHLISIPTGTKQENAQDIWIGSDAICRGRFAYPCCCSAPKSISSFPAPSDFISDGLGGEATPVAECGGRKKWRNRILGRLASPPSTRPAGINRNGDAVRVRGEPGEGTRAGFYMGEEVKGAEPGKTSFFFSGVGALLVFERMWAPFFA
jgi:hypothetical protein